MPKDAEALTRAGFDVEIVTSTLPAPPNHPDVGSDILPGAAAQSEKPILGLVEASFAAEDSATLAPGDSPADRGLRIPFLRSLPVSKTENQTAFLILHLEPALLAGHAAGVLPHAAVDFEDWCSEDLMPGRRAPELIQALQEAEAAALKTAAACWCTSRAMAVGLTGRHGANPPLVIRNTFPRRYREQIDGQRRDQPEVARRIKKNDPTAERPGDLPVSIPWFPRRSDPRGGWKACSRRWTA